MVDSYLHTYTAGSLTIEDTILGTKPGMIALEHEEVSNALNAITSS